MPSNNKDLDFGKILLEKKIISQEQLEKSIHLQKIRGGYLSQRLIELGYIKDAEATTYLTCYCGFCYLPLKSYNISESALNCIPAATCCDFCVFPIEKNDRLLSVTMADPLNKGVIQILRQTSGCEIIVFVSTRQEIKAAIEKYHSVAFNDFEMDRFQNDPFLRENSSPKRIWNGTYSGPSRRRYKRFPYDLSGEYYFYPNTFKAKITNVSMSGIQFLPGSPLPKGSQINFRFPVEKDKTVSGIVEIARADKKNTPDTVFSKNSQNIYEVGAFFDFMTEEDQNVLAEFLRQKAMKS